MLFFFNRRLPRSAHYRIGKEQTTVSIRYSLYKRHLIPGEPNFLKISWGCAVAPGRSPCGLTIGLPHGPSTMEYTEKSKNGYSARTEFLRNSIAPARIGLFSRKNSINGPQPEIRKKTRKSVEPLAGRDGRGCGMARKAGTGFDSPVLRIWSLRSACSVMVSGEGWLGVRAHHSPLPLGEGGHHVGHHVLMVVVGVRAFSAGPVPIVAPPRLWTGPLCLVVHMLLAPCSLLPAPSSGPRTGADRQRSGPHRYGRFRPKGTVSCWAVVPTAPCPCPLLPAHHHQWCLMVASDRHICAATQETPGKSRKLRESRTSWGAIANGNMWCKIARIRDHPPQVWACAPRELRYNFLCAIIKELVSCLENGCWQVGSAITTCASSPCRCPLASVRRSSQFFRAEARQKRTRPHQDPRRAGIFRRNQAP